MEIEPALTSKRESGAFAGARSSSCGGCLAWERITPESDTRLEIDWFWTCSGKAVVYREADALFTSEGTQIGHFRGDEIYSRQGHYLGEVARTGRLVTQLSKLKWRRSGFFPTMSRPLDPPPDLTSEHITTGFKDFKIPVQVS